MKYLVVLLGLCLLFAGLRADSSESSESSESSNSNNGVVEEPTGPPPCICQQIQDPVCGKFVVEYANACERNCAGALPAAPSECGLEEDTGNFLPFPGKKK